jgi:xanthine dehydrogenase molybdopterin-binding subunit B
MQHVTDKHTHTHTHTHTRTHVHTTHTHTHMHAHTYHTHTHTHTTDSLLLSVSGEAQYVNDLPTMPNEVYAAFCLTTVGQGYIANIDASEILVRYIVTKVDVGNLGTVCVTCCVRCRILVRNTVTTANTVNLRMGAVCFCIRQDSKTSRY